jgi:hypothetical protein
MSYRFTESCPTVFGFRAPIHPNHVSFVTIKAVKAIFLNRLQGISLILFYNKKPYKCEGFLSLSLK